MPPPAWSCPTGTRRRAEPAQSSVAGGHRPRRRAQWRAPASPVGRPEWRSIAAQRSQTAATHLCELYRICGAFGMRQRNRLSTRNAGVESCQMATPCHHDEVDSTQYVILLIAYFSSAFPVKTRILVFKQSFNRICRVSFTKLARPMTTGAAPRAEQGTKQCKVFQNLLRHSC